MKREIFSILFFASFGAAFAGGQSAVDPEKIRPRWERSLAGILAEANLQRPRGMTFGTAELDALAQHGALRGL